MSAFLRVQSTVRLREHTRSALRCGSASWWTSGSKMTPENSNELTRIAEQLLGEDCLCNEPKLKERFVSVKDKKQVVEASP